MLGLLLIAGFFPFVIAGAASAFAGFLLFQAGYFTSLVSAVILFALCTTVFGVTSRFWPGVPRRRLWRHTGVKTDLAYWAVNPWLTRIGGTLAAVAALMVVALIIREPLNGAGLRGLLDRESFVGRQPLWLQAIEMIALADLVSYWGHRAFHRQGTLWRYHAIHHSTMDLDWLSSIRVHPLNDAAMTFAQTLPLLLVGFSPSALPAFFGVVGFFAIALHANLSWTFGPLRYVISSPVYHRWHHTSEAEGLDKNFAGLLPIWDLVFGTFYMPKGRLPMQFGVVGEAVPEGLWQQMVYPLRRRRAVAT